MDVAEQNRRAWNSASLGQCDSSIPVGRAELERARRGDWEVKLTPNRTVPRHWFPNLSGLKVLCLGAGGGQQVPIMAAAGANVTSVELSEEQEAKDREIACANDLSIRMIRGDMTELDRFPTETFDMVFNPASTLFIADPRSFWTGCYRVLKPGGVFMTGSMNPSFYLFDHEEAQREKRLEVKYPLPYSDLESLTPKQAERIRRERGTIEYGHTLETLIGGQIESGFVIAGFYEDDWDDAATPLNIFTATSFATRGIKLERGMGGAS